MGITNILKNLFKKNNIRLNTIYQNDIPVSISYTQVKNALKGESLSEIIGVFEFFKRFDTQISSEIIKRKMQVARLPFVIESQDNAQDEFLKALVNTRAFRRLLFDFSSSISYGFSSFLVNWENIDSKIMPKLTYISHRYFDSDERGNPYLVCKGERVYLQGDDIYTLYHPCDAGSIIESGLMNKIVSLASLKHIAINRYISYLDSFSVPPLIIKSDAIMSKETSSLVLQSALNLRSNGVGLFAQNDVLEVLNGNVDKGTFLDFIRYCDECISKVITSQVLASNATTYGTQALGSVHEGTSRNVLEFDASMLAENVIPILNKTLKLNFDKIAAFSFNIDTNTEKDEKLQAEVYSILSNMGIEIPIEHLEKTFNIQNLKFNTLNIISALKDMGIKVPLSYLEKSLGIKGLEYDSKQVSQKIEPNKSNKDEDIDEDIDDFDKHFNALQKPFKSLLKNEDTEDMLESNDYEEMHNKLSEALKKSEKPNELSQMIANSIILGKGSAHDKL